MKENKMDFEICPVYDAEAYDKKFETGFGFSCFIRTDGKNILFDTGSKGKVLLENLSTLDIKPKDIDIVVLSHNHFDHVGGLGSFLKESGNVTIYAPQSFASEIEHEEVVPVEEPTKIIDGVYSTGELKKPLPEQALILGSKKGLVVITGCSHPGVENFVKKAENFLKKEVYLVLGGFHISDATNVINEFKKLSVQKVAPCHCTKSRAVQQFREEYGDNFIRTGVGRIIKV